MPNMQSMEEKKEWADGIIGRIDPSFKHHWEAFTETVSENLGSSRLWIDCGCGNNGTVRAMSSLAKYAVGVDVQDPDEESPDFVVADIRRLPFPSDCADLITLRFVVEHFLDIDTHFEEISRVLTKNGRVIILTTNTWSPLISIPRWLLPFSVKHRVLSRLFEVPATDIFPTHHRLNSPRRLQKIGNLRLRQLQFISDLNYTRKWIFMILLAWHVLTLPRLLHRFRMDLLAVLEKV
jgi:SAM-dependent methyltransferase